MKRSVKPLITILLIAAMLMSNIAMIATHAATDPYTVELAFNNIFVFEKWANNALSSTEMIDGVPTADKKTDGLVFDIENGSFKFTKSNMAAKEVYTAFSMGTEKATDNSSYYMMSVKPNTYYTFSYNLDGDVKDFKPFVFFYNEAGLFTGIDKGIISYTTPGNGYNSFEFKTPADVTSIQIRFTIGDNSTTRPGVTSVSAVVSEIAIYETELFYPNIFDFNGWATNKKTSSANGAEAYGYIGGTVSTKATDESITITTNTKAVNFFTNFSISTNPEETETFYMIDVEPSTVYNFSYNLVDCNNFGVFQIWIAMYDETGAFKEYFCKLTTGTGKNSFDFATRSDAHYIQVVFAAEHGGNSDITGTFKNIKLCKSDNLFNFDAWENSNSSKPSDFYKDGTITANSDDSIKLNASGALFTNFSTDPENASGNAGFYTISVKPNTEYTFSYTLSDSSFSSLLPSYALFNDDGLCTGAVNLNAGGSNGDCKFSITTGADTTAIQIAFGTLSAGVGTFKNIAFRELGFEALTGHSHRKSYEYGSNKKYVDLPTPSYIPEDMVFAGWYTGENGEGTRIHSDKEVHFESLIVYPKFEPEVDTLTVETPPAKTTYTKGEKFNPTGLVLKATQNYTVDEWTDTDEDGVVDPGETETKEYVNTFTIPSGYYCTPEYLTEVGETIYVKAHYGGKTVDIPVTVTTHKDTQLPVNGVAVPVKITNNEYTFEPYVAPAPFNRYEMTYFSDSYVKGVITMDDMTEEFFLEPSDNGSFASYIDSFLRGINHYSVASIKFTCLDKEHGNFELLSLKTVSATPPTDSTQYYENSEYKVGINLEFGGAVTYLEDLKNDVWARTYDAGNGNYRTDVDYKSKLAGGYTTESDSVNLINYNDRGRYLQQSYYGTNQPPFEQGNYNGLPWNYNPVQGGNIALESSKVIDYEITDKQIYIKTRPLDWAKWSDEAANKSSTDAFDPKYEDSYNTPSYMEAWYVFEDGMIKTYCRFVDYSGYPSHTTTQEMPALYTIEPLNNFVYSDGNGDWSDSYELKDIEEPDFWGVLPEYNALLKENGKQEVDVDVECKENWAAFTASKDDDSFGIGVYSAGVTDFHYGVFPAIYNETVVKEQKELQENYRHAQTLEPAKESPTSYISPVGVMTFESYKPFEYSFYITTGTAADIRHDFETVGSKDAATEMAKTKIAVPETVYLDPANNKTGEIYVNNVMDEGDYYNVETEAKSVADMYIGVHHNIHSDYGKTADYVSVKVTNVTNPSNEITFGNKSGLANFENTKMELDNSGTWEDASTYGLYLANALSPDEIATAKWEITFYKGEAVVDTHIAYTVMYAPERTVGAVSESRMTSAKHNEISTWITGINGVDHNKWSPLGSWKADKSAAGYFINDPLYKDTVPSGSSETANDYIKVAIEQPRDKNWSEVSDTIKENCYVTQAATNGHDDSRSHSYLGLLTVDKSRYTTTNQIPNFKIGFDVLRVDGNNPHNSLEDYYTMYTLGDAGSFTSGAISERPDDWTEKHVNRPMDSNTLLRETYSPAYNVAELDGKYIHALSQGRCQDNITSKRANAGTSVLCTVTDKGELREVVLNGYTIVQGNASAKRYNFFIEALEKAATVLGDPSATQAEIDAAKKALNDAIEKLVGIYFALKYDNLFSAQEFSEKDGSMSIVVDEKNDYQPRGTIVMKDNAITVESTMANKDVFSNYDNGDDYYMIDVKPNTEYVFEYDLETTDASQVYLFFYKDDGATEYQPINKTVEFTFLDGTEISEVLEDSKHMHYYASADGHVVFRFTTNAEANKMTMRFGTATEKVGCVSSFSNIRLVEASKYYEDVDYSRTEDSFLEDDAYGELMTLTRTGFTFLKWLDVKGTELVPTATAIDHKTVYSQWYEHEYTIKFDLNGGTGSIADKTLKYTNPYALSTGNVSKTGYTFLGWSTEKNASQPTYEKNATVSRLHSDNNAVITLFAIWSPNRYNMTFDNLIDFKAWTDGKKVGDAVGDGATKGTLTALTEDSLTITKAANVTGEVYWSSPEFAVTAGKKYKVEIDFDYDVSLSKPWDVYIFFRNTTTGGTGIEFKDDSTRRFSTADADGVGITSATFTAPTGATKAVIRLDANGADGKLNAVTFSNIRVYEVKSNPIDYTGKLANKYVFYDSAYPGGAPIPTRTGYDFLGWYNNSGTQYYNGSNSVMEEPVNFTTTLELVSKWQLNNDALEEDKFVVDFGAPVELDPVANDTIFRNEIADSNSGYKVSADEGNGFSVLNSKMIKFAPTEIVNSAKKIAYNAMLNGENQPTLSNNITVVPASNVLYEETILNATGTGQKWSTDKASQFGTSDDSTQDAPSATDVYGYDTSYAGSDLKYSGNTAYKSTVDASNRTSEKLTFSFKGTGFELYGACGADTGIQVINIKNSSNKTVKAAVVDTYYNDSYGTLYQTPIYNVSGLTYDTYTVEVTAAYLPSISGALNPPSAVALDDGEAINYDLVGSLADVGLDYILEADEVDVEWFDDDSILNGGTGANDPEAFGTYAVDKPLVNYVDAVRVFEPLNKDDDHYIDTEKKARYYNIVDNLLTDSFFGEKPGFVYVEGANGVFNAETYSKKGANHEVLLAHTSEETEAITFKVKDYDTDSRVMLSLRAASGNSITVKIGGREFNQKVSSKTEMYYDITDYVNEETGTVTIQNASADTLLSIGYLKLTGGATFESTSDLSSAIEMIETPLGGEEITSGSITNVEYTPVADSHNTFDVTVNGRPTMIQFIEEDGGTRTYDRNNKNVVIKSYNADGVEVNSLDRTVAYEVWTINTNLTGPDVKARAKYLADGAYKWEKDCYSFTYEILEPEFDADVRDITPAAVSGKKGSVEVKVVTGPDAEGIRFVMPNGTTCTYYAVKAVTLENGDLEFTGKAWMNDDGENLVKVYVRVNGAWTQAGEINYTVE